MSPVLLAGACMFSELHERARVFALCEMRGDPVLKPVSVVGDPAIRGIRIAASERRLMIQAGRLPATMVRAFIGLSVTRRHSLVESDNTGRGPFILKLALESKTIHTVGMRPAPSQADRYALLATLTRQGMNWVTAALVPREYYPDRRTLGVAHRVPTWWSDHA